MINYQIYKFTRLIGRYKKKVTVRARRPMTAESFIGELYAENTRDSNPSLIVSIDDISFKKKSLICSENGGSVDSYLIKSLNELLVWGIRPTLYFIPSPIFAYQSDAFLKTRHDYSVSSEEFSDTLSFYKGIESKGLIEICQHGLTHFNQKLNGYHSFEYDFLSGDEIKENIARGFYLMKDKFHISGFKPPAWSIGQLSGTEDIFLDSINSLDFFRYVSLSSPNNGLNYSKKTVSHCFLTSVFGMVNVPQNVSILWPLDFSYRVIDLIVEKGGCVNIQMHFQESTKYLQDGFSGENLSKLMRIVDYAKYRGATHGLTKSLLQ
jgi:hypothetical protein